MRHVWTTGIALLFCLATAAGAGAPESTHYVMDRVTISAAPARASSSNYEIHATVAQEGPVGSISFCNQGYAQSVGFWSLYGHAVVPVVLQAARDDGDPSVVDLSWSGSAAAFEVFRAEFPDSVADPLNVVISTPSCSASDAPPGGVPIVYYLVEPAGN